MQITVKVTAYTERGLYAMDREFPIADEHRGVLGFDMMMLFRRDAESIRQYALYTDGFRKGHQYLIEIRIKGSARFICNFILDKRSCAERETIPCLAY